MNKIICHHEGRYNLYNTVSNNFMFKKGININLLKVFIRNEYGSSGLRRLDSKLERIHLNGHSSIKDETLKELLYYNRAGEDGSYLTIEECISQFLSTPNKKENEILTKKSQKTQRKKRKRKERKRSLELESAPTSDTESVKEKISKDNTVVE